MSTSWIVTLVLLGLFVLWKLAKPLFAFFHHEEIGRRALQGQPDTIGLYPSLDREWLDVDGRERVTREMEALGFVDAGCFGIREMPGVWVRLLVHAGERAYAAIYEHQQAGQWYEFACFGAGGGSTCLTTLRPTGLDPRPGHRLVNLPGTPVAELWRRTLAERPPGELRPASLDRAVSDFESAYAEYTAWRKQAGLSRMEVVRAGTRRAA